jgi:asparaginyl-tRNA synthetase
VQCTVNRAQVSPQIFDLAHHISQESSVIIEGRVREDKRAPLGFEIALKTLSVVSQAYYYPISPKKHGVDFLMSQRHLWLRSKRQQAILRIRARLVKEIRDYLDTRGFILLDAPIFTPTACEGTTTLFATDYFGEKAYLTQSGQLYMEAGAMAFGRVYCFGPTFRAEKSKTRRHLTEFWMVEPEVAYMNLEEDIELIEDFVVYIINRVVKNCQEELKSLERDQSLLKNVKKPFPRITYKEAIELLKRKGVDISFGDDFGGDEETILAEHFDRPVFIHHYPQACKAFYMKQDPDDPNLTLSVDLIAPEGYGEIVGGGEREDNLEILEAAIKRHHLAKESFEWYLDLRRYGSVPHAGFGLGIERTVAWICGLHHVRETIPFPRLMSRLTP